MRQRILLGAAASAAAIVVIGLVVVGVSQGWLSPHGGAKRLLIAAGHDAAQGRLPEAQAKLEQLIGQHPDAPWVDDGLLALGGVYEQQAKRVESRAAYRMLLEKFPSSPLISQAQSRLGAVNVAILFSSTVTEFDTTYDVQPGDTLGGIARRFGTTIEAVKRANGIPNDVIRPKQKLKVPKGRFSVVVDKSSNQLLLTEENQFFKAYPVATGKDDATPEGTFTIVHKIPNPVWYKQGAAVPPDSPENILGTRWLGIDKKGYGIHGSVDPSDIGQYITAGCVRMTNTDVEELYAILPVGTEVTIVT
jgi:lipoprotein-anchoring transpeptidase ErfK/SrfK